MEMLTLNNGSSVPKPTVITTMEALKTVWDEGISGICAVSDLYERCRNPSHSIANGELRKLRSFSLVESNGQIHDDVKNVVLSAISGENFDIKLVSPIKLSDSTAPSLEELTAVIDGIFGVQMGIQSAVDHHGMTMEQIGIFVSNTPDGKKGEELWREFTSRRDRPDAEESYGFEDFIAEVIVEEASTTD